VKSPSAAKEGFVRFFLKQLSNSLRNTCAASQGKRSQWSSWVDGCPAAAPALVGARASQAPAFPQCRPHRSPCARCSCSLRRAAFL